MLSLLKPSDTRRDTETIPYPSRRVTSRVMLPYMLTSNGDALEARVCTRPCVRIRHSLIPPVQHDPSSHVLASRTASVSIHQLGTHRTLRPRGRRPTSPSLACRSPRGPPGVRASVWRERSSRDQALLLRLARPASCHVWSSRCSTFRPAGAAGAARRRIHAGVSQGVG